MQTFMIRTIGMMLAIFFVVPSLIAQQIESISEDTDEILALQNQMPDVNSEAYALLNQMIELNFSNLSIEEALISIAEKVDLKLMYRKELLSSNKEVSFQNSTMTVYEALWDILDGTDLQFALSQNQQLILLRMRDVERVLDEKVQETITGQVTDAQTGESLPGVNVVVQGAEEVLGSPVGTTTNVNGEFSVNVPEGLNTLIFTFIGYVSQTIQIDERTEINVELMPDIQLLDDVVVVGYGVQEERDVTGVVTSVDSDRFNRGVDASPDRLIAGKVSGVQITSSSGEPGAQSTIRIRGGTSITASNEPLFVIDGVPIDNSSTSGRNPLNFLNANDIENITVLKDASATAIYGSRGANGVILIQTKQGVSGVQSQISYSGKTSISRIAHKTPVLNADEFRQIVAEVDPSRLDMLGDADTDWQDEIMRDAITQDHALSMMGGSEDIRYRASLGYLNQQGIVKTSNLERLSASFNYHHQLIEDQLSVNANVRGSRTNDVFTGGIGAAVGYAPTQPVRDPDSPWGGFFEWEPDLSTNNPVGTLELTESLGDQYRSVGHITFDYQLPYIEGFGAELKLGYDVNSGENKSFAPSIHKSQLSDGGTINRNQYRRTNTLIDTYITYIRDVGSINSSFDFLGGYSFQEFNEEYPSFTAWDLGFDVLGINSTSPAAEHSTSMFAVDNRLISFFGRMNYSYKDRFLLTATIRRDGSSRFGPENQWGTFPSGAIGWRISEESFFRGLRPVISDLKFRFGWGINGNQEIGNFQFLPTYTFSDVRARYRFGDEFITTLRPDGVDPTLKWEETTSYNIGFDYRLFDDRISGSIEYYYKNTDDLLFTVAVPAGSNLTNRVLTNIGSVENEGIEFEIDGFILDRSNFTWNIGFNASTNRNEILKLTPLEEEGFEGFETGSIGFNNIQILRVGESVNSFFVFRHKRDQDGNPILDRDGNTMVDMYEDLNDDGVIDENDKVALGDPAPKVLLGFNSDLFYRNFDLNFTLRGSIGNKVYNNVASGTANYNRVIGQTSSNMHRSVLETPFQDQQLFSDFFVEDGSFLRMDNITLGYSLSGLEHLLERLRVYVTAQNLFLITNYSGLDPEVNQGIDGNIFPRSRTFVFGLDIDF